MMHAIPSKLTNTLLASHLTVLKRFLLTLLLLIVLTMPTYFIYGKYNMFPENWEWLNRNSQLNPEIENGNGNAQMENDSISSCPLLTNGLHEKQQPPEIESSYCSEKATRSGRNQRIISFSLFLPTKDSMNVSSASEYYEGIWENIQLMRNLYEGWLMRIYTHSHPSWNEFLCKLDSENTDVFVCNVEHLPILGDVYTNVYGMMWRFLPLGDPTVNIFVSRDLDSRLSQRERTAVAEWENSTKYFHAMRDHPGHGTVILGGLWGAKNSYINSSFASRLRNFMFGGDEAENVKGRDQIVLGRYIYPRIKNDILVHDSYFCNVLRDSVPFPTRREHRREFAGGFPLDRSSPIHLTCPLLCRPSYGYNWEYC